MCKRVFIKFHDGRVLIINSDGQGMTAHAESGSVLSHLNGQDQRFLMVHRGKTRYGWDLKTIEYFSLEG